MLFCQLFLLIALDTSRPVFPGGDAQMKRFISDSLRWPEAARDVCYSGTLFVSFTVEESGRLTGIKLLKKSILKCFDKEAIRLVKSMPAWIPAKVHGRIVRSEMQIPVRFTIQE